MNNLSIWKRLTSETPKFWVRVQIICLILSAVVGHVMNNMHMLTPIVGGILIGVFGAGAALAQLAVKDGDLIKDVAADPLIILDKFGELQNDFGSLKAAFANHNPATLDDIKKVLAESSQPAVPVAAPAVEAIAPAADQPAAQAPETINT